MKSMRQQIAVLPILIYFSLLLAGCSHLTNAQMTEINKFSLGGERQFVQTTPELLDRLGEEEVELNYIISILPI